MENTQSNSKAAAKVFEDRQKHFDAPCQSTGAVILSILRGRYPDWTVIVTPFSTGLIPYANAGHAKADFEFSDDLHTSVRFHQPPQNRMSTDPGQLINKSIFGRYNYTWRGHSFIVYHAEYDEGYNRKNTLFILAKRDQGSPPGPAPQHVDELITAASTWSNELHEEILVYDQQIWIKDSSLYQTVKSASWDDVILDKGMKETLIKDVEGFFDSQDDYKDFAVPWKRGVIFHGVSPQPLIHLTCC